MTFIFVSKTGRVIYIGGYQVISETLQAVTQSVASSISWSSSAKKDSEAPSGSMVVKHKLSERDKEERVSW